MDRDTVTQSIFQPKRALFMTPDMQRILDVQRRGALPPNLVADMTSVLRTDAGTMTLKEIQAQALYEVGTHGGGFLPVRVGGGKTLISLLVPYVLGATRPVLLLPANLIAKTERAILELSKHWRIPRNIRIVSYESLGRVSAADMLEFYRPDLLVLDEGHRAKNKRAGVTRRLIRYMRGHPETKCVIMSGTMMRKSIKDFAHLARWAMKDNAPVPDTEGSLEEWACVLDEKVNPNSRLAPGPLLSLPGAEPDGVASEIVRARRGFRRRLTDTPGIVSTAGEQVACSLYIEGHTFDVQPATHENFTTLRDLWETPDGWTLSMAAEAWRVARELKLGFHAVWDPRPPPEWLAARKAWAKFVRETLSHSRTLDTDLQVWNACAKGTLPDAEMRAWEAIKPSFTIQPKDVWHDTSALEWCEAWMKKGPGLVWTEHTFFAEALAKRTGARYFGPKGLDQRGEPIPEHPHGGNFVAILSLDANKEGRNLQRWNRMLFTTVPPADQLEQAIGREHRDGQDADEVLVDILVGCAEDVSGWDQALADARATRDSLGDEPKILNADIVFPSAAEIMQLGGSRFVKTQSVKTT